MTQDRNIEVKICGLKTGPAVETAVSAGVDYIGFNHFEKSPRFITPNMAKALAARLPRHVKSVALLVDPADTDVRTAAAWADIIQLHGSETPARCAEITARSGKPVIKALAISTAADLLRANDYTSAAAMLLLDAKPPPGDAALPGGNGIAFDWRLLQNATPALPWMLSGGLTVQNVAEAASLTRATRVDVSSGVESERGVKSMALIEAFIKAAKQTVQDCS